MKPILLYWRNKVPNPLTVLVILQELDLPYKISFVEAEGLRNEPYRNISLHGVPAINDPNTNVVLFESNAIVSYLVDTYDKSHKLTYETSPEKYLLQQWSFFQASGQGSDFLQCAWFNLFHPEVLESAQMLYMKKVERIVEDLDRTLKGKDWLVGDKCTHVDLAFVVWNAQIHVIMKGHDWNIDDYPDFKRWQAAMMARDSLKKVMSLAMETESIETDMVQKFA